jgi:hypothetical protein
MLRNVGAVIAGLVVGMMFNMAIIQLNMTVLHPAPADLDPNDTVQFQEYMDSLPIAAFLVVMIAHLGQAFFGGWVASKLSASHGVMLAMIIGALSLVGGLMMMIVTGPTWMYIELPLYLILAWIAGRLGQRGREQPPG